MNFKAICFTLFLFSFPFLLSGQATQKAISIDEILDKPIREISYFDTSGFGAYQVAIRFPYASAKALNPEVYDAIKSYGKVSVEYIYSKYTQSQPGQKTLDRQRFQALKKLAPDLFDDHDIRWDIVVQNAAQTGPEAQQLFHGFVITYQPPITEERKMEIREDLDLLVECAKKRPPDDAPQYPGGMDSLQNYLKKNIKFPKDAVNKPGTVKAALVEWRIDDATGKPVNVRVTKGVSLTHNDHIKSVVGKMPAWKAGNSDVEFSMFVQFSMNERKVTETGTGPLRGYDPVKCRGVQPVDSTVKQVLTRNKEWKKILVVEDVTGSMMPYVADLLLWNALKGNMQNTEHFVFFNDGDAKDDYVKTIGSTGGIYQTKPVSVDAIQKVMIEAIAGGNGGDTPENDIEAILEGIKACPQCEEVVLIADNEATPRDLELIGKITKPVHVILCGVRYEPNLAHLNIALKTKGSVHTLSEDINELAKLQEGQTIKIMGQTYRVKNGAVVNY